MTSVEKPLIFIVDDEIPFLRSTENLLNDEEKYNVIAFNSSENITDHHKLKDVDLLILDIKLPGKNGIDLYKDICIDGISVPALFISGFFDKLPLHELNGCIYDFMEKPFPKELLFNRIDLLLKVAKSQKRTIKRWSETIWDIFNYLNYFLLILDENMNILLGNYFLATKLGFDNEDDLIEKNWLQFTTDDDKALISYMHKELSSMNIEDYEEHINDIVDLEGNRIPVRWFNSPLNHGAKGSFSIGIPLHQVTQEDNIDSIRSYWRDIINKDKSAIQAMRAKALNQ